MKKVLFNTPRRRRYDIGGARDTVNNVTGSNWGAGKGIVGQKIGKGVSQATSMGATIGLGIGSIIPGIGTALGGLIGAGAGILSGIIGGGLIGRNKKKKAEAAAYIADMTKNYELGQDAIRTDQAKLDEIVINNNPIDIYGDNPQPVSNPGVTQLNPNVGRINPANGLVYRNGGKRRHYAGGGQILQVASDAAIVNGPSHEQGGVPYGNNAEVEGGEAIMQGSNADYIFSDTLTIGNRTFADAAKPLMQHKGYLEQQLDMTGLMLGKALQLTERSTYAIDRNTNARDADKKQIRYSQILQQIQQVQAELDNLYNQQEAMKAKQGELSEPRTEMRFGGNIRKYDKGGMDIGSPLSVIDNPIAPINNPQNFNLAPMENTGKAVNSTGTTPINATAAAGITSALQIGAQIWNEAATNRRNKIVAGLPDHIQSAVTGFRCGGKRKHYEAGGEIQLSPFTEIPREDNNYTSQMISKPFELNPEMLNLRLGGRRRRFKGGGTNPIFNEDYINTIDEDLEILPYNYNDYLVGQYKAKANSIFSNGSKEFMQDNAGNILKSAGSLITGLLATSATKKNAKALMNKPIPKRQLLDRISQEWDINTDASRKEVIDQVQAIERFVKDNSSNAQVARQLALKARSNGSKNLGQLKQQELLQELGIRNETRKLNKDIDAKNKEIKYLNQLDEYARNIKALKMLNQGNDAKMEVLANFLGDIGNMYQSSVTNKNAGANELINLLQNEQAAKLAKTLDYDTQRRAFNRQAALWLRGMKRKGGKCKKYA